MSRVRPISSSDDDDERSRQRLEKAHVGSNEIGTEERDRVHIDKQARLTGNGCAPETAASGGLGVEV